MKTILTYILLGALIVPFTSCKKGANDPFLSLKSRKSRLVGDWELSSGEVTTTTTGSGQTSTTTETYNGSSKVTASTAGSSSVTYTESWTFEKDESFNNTVNEDGKSYVSSGFWQFGGKNKSADLKNKETVVITSTKDVAPNSLSTKEGKGVSIDGVITLDKLSNKELVMMVDYTYSFSSGYVSTVTGTMTYTAK